MESFYRILEPPRLDCAAAIQKAVARGVGDGTFGYTSGIAPTLGPDGKYQVSREKVAIDRTLADDEVDLDSGFLIVPSAIPAPPEPTPTGETTPGDGGETGPPAVTPTGGETTGTDTGGTTAAEMQKTVRIRFQATRDQVFKAFPAIANLADKSNDGKVEIEVVGNSEEGFDQNWFRNAVEEPLDEA
ncbi:MAG: AAA family ATPase, partial [Planctomycetes bacterium]|nr:AAA family ATPase [Planctomycetota bacterium]